MTVTTLFVHNISYMKSKLHLCHYEYFIIDEAFYVCIAKPTRNRQSGYQET